MTHEAMVKRFKYLTNTTPTAIKNGYTKKDIKCGVCVTGFFLKMIFLSWNM